MSAMERSPTPASESARRRRRRDWTRLEEQHLVDILTEHTDWAAILIHNRGNDRVGGANKTAIAKAIGLKIRTDDPPDAKGVTQKVKSLRERFKSWYDKMGQTGQGLIHADLQAGSPLLRDRNRILQEEPWFDQFHQLYINRQPAHTLDIYSGASTQDTLGSQLPALSQLELNNQMGSGSQASQSLDLVSVINDNSDSDDGDLPTMGSLTEQNQTTPAASRTPAPSVSSSRSNQSILSPDQISSQLSARKDQLIKKRKHSIFSDDHLAALSQSQVHISDNNLRAAQLQIDHQMALRQEEHSFMERIMEKMDTIAARRDEQMQGFMKDLIAKVLQKDD